MTLLSRTLLVVFVLGAAILCLSPNFTSNRLTIVFHETRWQGDEKVVIPEQEVDEFIADRENGLGLYFPENQCIKAADNPRQCTLSRRFLTEAQVNELAQAFPEFIDEDRTFIQPDAIERFFSFLSEKSYKNLRIKLGLDLQGGMRAVLRADFDHYVKRLRENYAHSLKELEGKIAAAPEAEKTDLLRQKQDIESKFVISEERKVELLAEAKRVIDKRLASQNLTEPEVRVQPGSYSIAVDMPGAGNSQEVLRRIKDTVTVEYRIVQQNEAADRLREERFDIYLQKLQELYTADVRPDPREIEVLLKEVVKEADLKPEDGQLFLYWRRGRKANSALLPREFRLLGPVVMDGNDMSDAQASINPLTPYYRISFVLNADGATKFADITTANRGKQLAILWGDRVMSEPNINEPITGGMGEITGQFEQSEAEEVASVIKEGALPLSLEVLSVSFVGPSLGLDSIAAGLYSIAVGFFLVVLFMVLYYKLSGFVAIVALFFNVVLMLAVLSLLEFTLTLPGLAGIILTVGMAVDANVIIFEKMKEEVETGRSPALAIESGYASSFWTILDANITTIIAAIILFYTKDGPIMGFAITLFWGLVASMFTALFVTRWMYDLVQKIHRLKTLSIGWSIQEGGR